MTRTRSQADWRTYPIDSQQGSIEFSGALLLADSVYSPQLRNRRPVAVYLPASYHNEPFRHYPVVYMQDGQNLFDPAVSYGGITWSVPDAVESLADIGREPIVVGIYHGGRRRIREYNPFADWRNGRGVAYARFVAETIKPMIDEHFRTLPDRMNTAIVGSSMGGLISLYTFFAHGDTFSLCGAMSPSLWVANGAILRTVSGSSPVDGRIYLDNGSEEPGARQLAGILEHAGYMPDVTMRYVVGRGDGHTEAAWARRLPGALSFLLA